jgi:hypothetical protein
MFKNNDYLQIAIALDKRIQEREELVSSLEDSWPFPSVKEELRSEKEMIKSDKQLKAKLADILSTFNK